MADPEQPQLLWTWASCQIEVPDALADRHEIRKLRRGDSVLAAGQLSNRWTAEPGYTGKRGRDRRGPRPRRPAAGR